MARDVSNKGRKPVMSEGLFRACECQDEALRSEPFFIGGRPNLLHR